MLNEAAFEIFHRNSRFPEQSRGDARALMASVELGARRMVEVLERFGPAVVADALRQLLERTRRLVRARLAETFAPGTHRFTDAIDTDGHGSGRLRLSLALTRERDADGADRFTFDATDTDDQARGPVNFLMNPDVPGMALGLFFLGADPAQVCNAGGPRALDDVRLREGSLLRPRFPAPLGMRGLTMMRFLAALNGLVNVAGGQAPASHSAYVIILLRGRWTDAQGLSQPFLLADGIGVGYGARTFADGLDAVYFTAQENYPVEFLENGYPVRLRAYGVVPDSGGAGRHRGGCGILREYEVLSDECVLAVRIDGVENPPWGTAGGLSGGGGRATVNPGTPHARVLPALSDGHRLARGDVLRLETGGGGGHGHPFDRPPAAVLADVAGGFVTPAAALALYGVALREAPAGWAVDEAATAARRAERPRARAFHRHEYVDVLT